VQALRKAQEKELQLLQQHQRKLEGTRNGDRGGRSSERQHRQGPSASFDLGMPYTPHVPGAVVSQGELQAALHMQGQQQQQQAQKRALYESHSPLDFADLAPFAAGARRTDPPPPRAAPVHAASAHAAFAPTAFARAEPLHAAPASVLDSAEGFLSDHRIDALFGPRRGGNSSGGNSSGGNSSGTGGVDERSLDERLRVFEERYNSVAQRTGRGGGAAEHRADAADAAAVRPASR
jgi:hypothetical protein